MEEYKVIDENSRLDKYITDKNKMYSRSIIQKMIEEGNILVNGKKTKSSYKVAPGDVVTIKDYEPKEDIKLKPQKIELNVIYEDKDIIIINKENGMVVHPGNGNPDGTLANAILERCKDSLSGIGGTIRPGIVHRIDKDTSGLVIVAKNDSAHVEISKQIQERKVTKTYIALVRGNVKENEATINMPIGRSSKDRKKMAVSKKGKEAITHFKVLKRYDGFTLLELEIETGRTHQIRVHLAEIGFPIVGDMVYSNGKNPFGVEGQMLHAAKLEFVHPTTNKKVIFEAPLPKYFLEVLDNLQK